jgi:hypothetical protein
MALEKRLIDGHVLDCHDALLAAAFEYAVNQEKGISVRQNRHDLAYVQPVRRILPGVLVFHGRRADYRAFRASSELRCCGDMKRFFDGTAASGAVSPATPTLVVLTCIIF